MERKKKWYKTKNNKYSGRGRRHKEIIEKQNKTKNEIKTRINYKQNRSRPNAKGNYVLTYESQKS